jgi:hypothetical protein
MKEKELNNLLGRLELKNLGIVFFKNEEKG